MLALLTVSGDGDPIRVLLENILMCRMRIGTGDDVHAELATARPTHRMHRDHRETGCGNAVALWSDSRQHNRRRINKPPRYACDESNRARKPHRTCQGRLRPA